MTTGRSDIERLVDAVAGLGDTRVVLLCFAQESLSQSDAAGRFLREMADAFAGRVTVSCVRPESASDVAHEFAVAGVVTPALFVDGKEAARSVGEGGETMMRKLVERNVKGL